MTNEQLERAARHLCMLNGVDPDERVKDRHSHYDYCGYVKQWENWVPLVTQYIQVQQAIKEAVNTTPPVSDKTKLICDVLHYCMFCSPKTQEMTVGELKHHLAALFEAADIDAAISFMTTEEVVMKNDK